MRKKTKQMVKWEGEFGRKYTDRNDHTIEEMENLYLNRYGFTRSETNNEFIGDLDRSIRILEVGCNIGNQLLCLQTMGFTSLYGIELQEYSVELAKKRTKNINIIQGSAFDIPYKDNYFNLVFTSGLLIHIAPSDIEKVLKEIYRCSNKYIWGIEYYADVYSEIEYREHKGLLWKNNFSKKYLELFNNLHLVKEKKYKYLNNDNVDSMFLIKK